MTMTMLNSPVFLVFVLFFSSELFGFIFAKLRQPPVIGEIIGGLIWGPSLFSLLATDYQWGLWHINRDFSPLVAFLKSIGLQFLMFCSGMELKSVLAKKHAKTVFWLTLVGAILPVVIMMAILPYLPLD